MTRSWPEARRTPAWLESTLTIFGASLLFYLLTAAPTVLWGDSAEYQWRAVAPEIAPGIRGHPLYIGWAHLFTRLPLGDVAFRVNLLSAVAGAVGVAFAYALLRRLGTAPAAAWAGAGALAVSHTFWTHAVIAEVYAPLTALLLAFMWAGVRWLDEGRPLWLGLAAGLWGLSLGVHLMAVGALPALLLLGVRLRRGRDALAGLAGLLVGGGISLGLILACADGGTTALEVGETARALLHAVPSLPRALLFLVAYLVLQFPAALFLAPAGLHYGWNQGRSSALFLALVWGGNVLPALFLRLPDQHVFYLPAYAVTAVWIGLGAERLLQRGRPLWRLCLGALGLPVLLYIILPIALNAAGLNPLHLRDLPARDGNLYHLLPAKTGYFAPRAFGQEVLASLPQGAVVIADHTIRQNLLYHQRADGRRPDVDVVEIYSGQGQQAPFIAEMLDAGRPVFLGSLDRYVDLEDIRSRWCIVPYGVIYQVLPDGGADARCH